MYKVSNKISAPALGDAVIKGPIGERMELFFDERVKSDFAWDVVYREAEDAFKNKVDDESGVVGLWQGEFWGKLIISAVRVCEYSGDAKLKERIRSGVRKLISYQEPDGYIGTYKNPAKVLPADREKAKPIMGWPCDWNWNVWCRKYTLWGLLEAYRLLGEPEILKAAVRLADHLIKQLAELGLKIWQTGTFLGMPSCSIMKPMLVLYEITGDARYLDFCLEIAKSWDGPSGNMPNLIAHGISGKPVHEWKAESWTWAKVYEMLSCLDGLLELHRVSGDARYLEAVERLHALLWKHERNPMFNVGYNDIFANAAAQLNGISEPCDAIHFMRVSYELFALTGKSSYMDVFELTYYNAFLASVYRDGKWGARGVRSSGRHQTSTGQAGFVHNHCCVDNMPRGFMNAAQAGVMASGDIVYVNLYSEFSAKLKTPKGEVGVEIGEGYLSRGEVDVRVSSSHMVKLRFRIPAWSRKTSIEVAGQTLHASAGSFFEFQVGGEGPSETVVALRFDNSPVLALWGGTNADFDEKTWTAERWTNIWQKESSTPYSQMFRRPMSTLQAGPLLLARSKFIGNTEKEIFEGPFVSGESPRCRLTPVAGNARYVFDAEFESKGAGFKTRVCDYASAGDAFLDDDSFFSLFF